MTTQSSRKLPVAVLFGALVLIGSSFLLSAYSSLVPGGREAAVEHTGSAVFDERSLVFVHDDDGSLNVVDGDDGRPVAAFDADGASFVRGAMKGLAYTRRDSAEGAEAPYRLTLFTDGHLVLTDPLSGEVVDLGAFGVDNARAFAALLETGGNRP